eukprot:CAMPEP_0201513906 /NCGR_PEP_ID=MMETSP0161_2-20130828/5866_1 /ASSEMBLY_ACC=CAM_ASM_000251 /TAXON_ID=180227 /ORGANISM="Neoparamoeba aestuarina, Strain SoJaBio B1-5/56/2" /LENGTH=366 /DNA_ID=CAMNT_0047910295 /DNA_START=300 /DNA_END=1400 /DNA_ORIENTATION=+
MGQGQSRIKKKDAERLSHATIFSVGEIRTLFDRFQAISESIQNDGVIDLNELRHSLGSDSVIASRVFSVLDDNGDGVIQFPEFVMAMSILCGNEMEEKINFCFKIYDVNRDGTIAASELEEMIKATLFNNLYITLTDEEIHKLVMDTFQETDADGDGSIDLAEFRRLCHKYPNIVNLLTIDRDLLRMDHSSASDSDLSGPEDEEHQPSPRLMPAELTRAMQAAPIAAPGTPERSTSQTQIIRKKSKTPTKGTSGSALKKYPTMSEFGKTQPKKPLCKCDGNCVPCLSSCNNCIRCLGGAGPIKKDKKEKKEKEEEEKEGEKQEKGKTDKGEGKAEKEEKGKEKGEGKTEEEEKEKEASERPQDDVE